MSWQGSFAAEIRAFKSIAEFGVFASQPGTQVACHFDVQYRQNADPYSGVKKDKITLITFLRIDVAGMAQGCVFVLNGQSYSLNVIDDEDEISVSYVVL
ncbi:hypothetical protein [Pseudoalteromonas ulvae]|uniref:Uncharacterized protein n=1 Tax=Pseudoalteromonas ulvae TaxID=107327 RepID=A0A244CUH0_PSEDV|nr:hypothetical protein [Pseudoalteromonas ulvae]OUL59263.1 hypothetical protein B1199_03060 [Pseudoalteromonas ulvae]